SRDLAARLAVGLGPLLLGLLASLVWLAAGRGARVYVLRRLTWIPLLLGAAATAVLAPALLAAHRERRRAEQARRQALEQLAARHRRVLTRLDHELKNPIQGIRVALADEPSDRQRASIDAQSQRLTGLLRDLRRLGEVEETALELAPIDITALVEEAVDAMTELPGAVSRQVTVALPRAPRPLPHLVGDEDLLYLVLANALSNAVKYSEEQDAIEVRGREEDGMILLEIADTGHGIPADELETVWEELSRSRESRGIEGTGLGLPLVRAILERHGGTETLESRHGERSTRTLRLPVAGPPDEPVRTEHEEPGAPREDGPRSRHRRPAHPDTQGAARGPDRPHPRRIAPAHRRGDHGHRALRGHRLGHRPAHRRRAARPGHRAGRRAGRRGSRHLQPRRALATATQRSAPPRPACPKDQPIRTSRHRPADHRRLLLRPRRRRAVHLRVPQGAREGDEPDRQVRSALRAPRDQRRRRPRRGGL